MNAPAGRSCPLRYHYGAESIARLVAREVETLYVVGGLYGNLPALNTIEAMAAAENGPVSVIFNGDFNWFNVDHPGFDEINRRVLQHNATQGNVEAELGADSQDAGCGCAYPDHVASEVVERSNQIHATLRATACQYPAILANLAALPMTARFRVGDCAVAVVHGDADSLAGWRFDAAALDAPNEQDWLRSTFDRAGVDVFASTHTCQAVLRQIALAGGAGCVINNGAAGMPNCGGRYPGLLSRISMHPSPHRKVYGVKHKHVWIDALPIEYDQAAWIRQFLANWPKGTPAWRSYHARIVSMQRQPDGLSR